VEIPLAEGPVNLNWGTIMKTINENPYEFFKEGGWGFLGGTGAEEGGSDAAGSDSESSFEAESVEDESSASESESDDYTGDSDASDESVSQESFSEGEDWDELERKAEKCEFLSECLSIMSGTEYVWFV